MNFPPIVYSLAFWKMLSYLAAAVLAALVALGKLPAESAVEAAVILASILTVLNALGIEPEIRALVEREQALKLQSKEQKRRK
jgi:hypothetical protein